MEGFENKREKEFYAQLMPVAALEFLKEHNVFEDSVSGRSAGEVFNELMRSNGEKCGEVHPLFNTSVPDSFKDTIKPPLLREFFFKGVKQYVQWKRGELSREKLSEIIGEKKFVSELIDGGPYGHGGEIVCSFRNAEDGLVNFANLNEELIRKSIAISYLSQGTSAIHDFPQRLMYAADVNGKHSPVFEKTYLEVVESWLAIIPRFLTLLARDWRWDISEMDAYIEAKHIEHMNTFLIDSSEYQQLYWKTGDPKLREGSENLSVEDMAMLQKVMRRFADVYKVIREYLENNVRYKDEANAKVETH
jgi:hypothetical protein